MTPNSTPDSHSFTIRLRTIGELFTAPERDPWRDGPEPVVSGVGKVLAACGRKEMKNVNRLVIALDDLPGSDAELVARAPEAWKNHCLSMARRCESATQTRRKTGWSEIMALLPVIAVALALSAFFDHVQPLPVFLNRIFSEGFIVIGWVLLWHPVESLVFEAGERGLGRRAFERLAQMQVEVVRAE